MTAPAAWSSDEKLNALTRLIGRGLAGAAPAAAADRVDGLGIPTLALALEHGVGGLLHRAQGCREVGRPGAATAILARHAAANEQCNRAAVAELQRLRAVLGDANVAMIPLKGPWLGQRLYGDLSIRLSRDIDFLIGEDAIRTALAALAAAGYAVAPPLPPRPLAAKARYAGQFLMHRHDGRFAIEPHWALAPWTLSLGLDHGGLCQRSRTCSAGGLELPTLAPEDEFIMLCVHGFKEDWARLKLIADLAQFAAVHVALDWDVVAARARAQGVWWIVLLGVVLIATVFGAATGLTRTALGAREPVRVAALLLARITAAASTPRRVPVVPSIYHASFVRWRIRERRLDRARYLWRTVGTPREAHFLAVPLPEWMFPAYVGVKLLHDYVALPCWLLGKRARRAAARGSTPVRGVVRAGG